MNEPDQLKHRHSSLKVDRAERGLVLLAIMSAMLVGLVDSIGVLAFGHVLLTVRDANATRLGANPQGNYLLVLFGGAMVLSFLSSIVWTILTTYRITRFRQTFILLATSLALAAAFGAFGAGMAITLGVLLAIAMGGAHCIFVPDNPELKEALSPAGLIARLGDALSGQRNGANHRQIGLYACFWLALLLGGLAGAGAWVTLDGGALVLAASIAGLINLCTWLIERGLLPT